MVHFRGNRYRSMLPYGVVGFVTARNVAGPGKHSCPSCSVGSDDRVPNRTRRKPPAPCHGKSESIMCVP